MAKLDIVDFFYHRLSSMDPAKVVRDWCEKELELTTLEVDKPIQIGLFGLGKASLKMAEGLLEVLSKASFEIKGLVIFPNTQRPSEKLLRLIARENCSITLKSSNHPLPDKTSFEAGRLAYLFFENFDGSYVLSLISGGGSSLMCYEDKEIRIEEKIDFLKFLLSSGIPEREQNVLKKKLSRVKGGRLARLASCPIKNLIISDEREDDISAISSGPTVACHYESSQQIISTYLEHSKHLINKKILNVLECEEGVFPDHAGCEAVASMIVSSRQAVIDEIVLRLASPSIPIYCEAHLYGDTFGDSLIRVLSIFEIYEEKRRSLGLDGVRVVFSGEIQVQNALIGHHRSGGRNQHLALAIMLGSAFRKFQYKLYCMSTDGLDFIPGVRGAVASSSVAEMIREQAYDDASSHFEDFNSGVALDKFGCLIKGHPTGTNVSDIYILELGGIFI